MNKAFDKVQHCILLKKLRTINIKGNLHSWFSSYLCGRKQRVTLPGGTLSTLAVTSGVPQGSILGPVLFLIYVNEIHDIVTSSSVSCFADDTKLFKTIHSGNDANLLQEDLNNLTNWSESSGLTFNELKSNCQTVTRKRAPLFHQYTINDKPIGRLDEQRDLGVRVNSKLSWSSQVASQISAANKSLGCVRRSVSEINDVKVRRILYLAIVRPHLGYATQIWSPQSINLIKRVARVQRRATKVILNLPFRSDTTYEQRLNSLNLLPLTYWHEFLDLVFFFKIVHNLVKINPEYMPSQHIPTRTTRTTSDPNLLYFYPKRCKTLTFQRSFFSRTCRIWNQLPDEMRRKDITLLRFRGMLEQFYRTAACTIFNSDDPRTWKSVCLKCNSARILSNTLSCCN